LEKLAGCTAGREFHPALKMRRIIVIWGRRSRTF
jgi:hypothetical protein